MHSVTNTRELPVYNIKLVLLGDSAVGKSSLALRYVKQDFSLHQDSTIGAMYLTQQVNLQDATINFEIWDTAGQERYHSLAPMYYRGALGAIIVYDVTDPYSFTRAKNWIKELRTTSGNPEIVIILVGNKIDLVKHRRIDYNEAKRYADDNKITLFESSAKTNINVEQIFDKMATLVPKIKKENPFIILEESKQSRKWCCK